MIRLRRLLQSFRYAIKGFFKVVREEQNLKIQFLAAIVVVATGICLRVSSRDWALLVLAILFVLLTEVINSALERVTDILKTRLNGYVKEIKDIMAAAVMLASIGAVIIGLLVFLPYLQG
jgi:diacylglycerol kinase